MDTNLDIFQPGEKTAMVCVDVPEMQRLISEQMAELGYKAQLGFSLADIQLKLRAQQHDLLVISEHFGGATACTNVLLDEAVHAPAAQRHKQFLVLIGSQLTSNDEMQAFQHSVDLVVNIADVMHLRALVRRGLARAEEFYGPFHQMTQAQSRAAA